MSSRKTDKDSDSLATTPASGGGAEGAKSMYDDIVSKILHDLTITRSSTFREVSGSLMDTFALALDEGMANELTSKEIFPKILCALNAPQFNGRPASLTLPGALTDLRCNAFMALGALTTKSLYRAHAARSTPGMVPCVVRVLTDSYAEDPLLAMWGCGTLANLLQGCVVENKDVRDRISTVLIVILRNCTKPYVFAAAVTAMRVFGSSHNGKASLIGNGFGDLFLDELMFHAREIESREKEELERARLEHERAEQMSQESREKFIPTPTFHLVEEVQLLRTCLARHAPSESAEATLSVDSTPMLGGTPPAEEGPPEFVTTPLPQPSSLAGSIDPLSVAPAAAAAAVTGDSSTSPGNVRKPQYYCIGKSRDGPDDDFIFICQNCAPQARQYILGPQLFDNVCCEFKKCCTLSSP